MVPTVIIPMNPGITSALGLLMTDLRHDYVMTYICRADQIDLDRVNGIYGDFESQGRSLLAHEGVKAEAMLFSKFIDMRYVGQSYELTIPLPGKEMDAKDIVNAVGLFHKEHERAYGHCAPEEPVQIANLKLSATGLIAKPKFREFKMGGISPEQALRTSRKVYFAEADGFVACPAYDRYRLIRGNVIRGPAIVDDKDATTVVHPGYQAVVGKFGNLILTMKKGRPL
jgi:N-methylhydantoinase A